jgi:peptidoglycan/LPS O-acetylase OafA/YrhL
MYIKVTSQTVGSREKYLPALDGLRFMAAMLVAGGHYVSIFSQGTASGTITTLTGLGMTLFFVLSGFVIHYNYCDTIPKAGGVRAFAVARFARLYPLYIALFVVDFGYTVLVGHGACGRADETGYYLALANYLTLTQSWFYAVICKSSLIYQYGPVAAVSWSISVEAFFYVVYIGVAKIIARRKWPVRRIVGLSAASYLAVVSYLFGCAYLQPEIDLIGLALFGPVATVDAGYQDSLLRWLFYFNPVARLGEFFLGTAAAHLFLARKSSLATLQSAQSSVLVFAAVVGALAIHIILYDVVASRSVTIGRIASPLYAPAVALVMYLVVRYDTFSSRFLSNPVLMRFGEASYSIYLLHEVLPSLYKRLGILAFDPSLFWPMWGGSLILLALVSRASFVCFERPVRLAIRKWLAPGPVPRPVQG